MRIKHESIDIYPLEEGFTSSLAANNKGLIIFTEHEYGCASHLAVSPLVDIENPVARVMSHLINNNVFNQTEEFDHIGWGLFFYKGYTFVNISRWPQTSIFPAEQAQSTWIHIYPPVRDLLDYLQSYGGHKKLYFLSSTTIHDALDNDIFKIFDSSEIVEYDFTAKHEKRGDGNDLFFSPPTWLFPYFADLLGYKIATAVVSGNEPDKRVDRSAGMALMNWLENNLDVAGGEEILIENAEHLESLFERNDVLRSEMQSIITKNEPPKNSMLWG
jgi:hypothetical protein